MNILSTREMKIFQYGGIFILLAMLLSNWVSAAISTEAQSDSQERISDVIVEYVPSNVVDAAVEGLDIWGDAVVALTMSKAGRTSLDKQKLRLGTPYEVFTLSENYIKKLETVQDDTLVSKNEWLFPILMGDSTLCWMRIQYMDARWVSSGVGGSGNAKLIENLSNLLSINRQKRAIIDLDFSSSATVVIWDEKEGMEDGRYFNLNVLEKHPCVIN